MKNIVLVSHGGLAEGAKASLEMIAGHQDNLHTVTLRPDGDNLQFERDLKDKMKSLSGQTLIIADLLGGTPANVSMKLYGSDDNVEIMTGLSLPLVLEAVLNGDRKPQEILASAMETMQDLKAKFNESTSTESESAPQEVENDLSQYKDYAGKANVVNCRIDERLIHGQVAGIWSTSLNTQRIIVINTLAATDNLQKSSLRMAAPKSMRLSVLTPEKAAKNINAGKYGNQRIFLLFKTPADVKEFLAAGGKMEHLNVGNMSFKDGNREITKSVYISKEEEGIFEEIANQGIKITAQRVPNDPITDFMKKMKG